MMKIKFFILHLASIIHKKIIKIKRISYFKTDSIVYYIVFYKYFIYFTRLFSKKGLINELKTKNKSITIIPFQLY
jgi:hypothetical protein